MTDQGPHANPDDPACIEVVERVTDHLEGALSEEEALRLRLHLENCPGCGEYVDQLRMLAGALSGLPGDTLPAEKRAAIVGALRDLRD